MKRLKVGDVVFVVYQRTRYDTRNATPPRQESQEVVRVGRKFGYVKRYGREEPFELDTGRSSHKESNVRTNGQGFDVYETQQEYERIEHERSEYQRLEVRIRKNSWSIVELPPDAVEKIHAVLDEVETKGLK
jgi:hypothetical protein